RREARSDGSGRRPRGSRSTPAASRRGDGPAVAPAGDQPETYGPRSSTRTLTETATDIRPAQRRQAASGSRRAGRGPASIGSAGGPATRPPAPDLSDSGPARAVRDESFPAEG